MASPVTPVLRESTHPTPAYGASAVSAGEELRFGQVWKDAGNKDTRPGSAQSQDGGRRRSTIQFHTAKAEDALRKTSTTIPRITLQRRISSPPPPPTYRRGVSFDTFDNKDASTESLTLQYKHSNHRHSTRSRTFLCGTDTKDYSEYALEWMIDELVDDGDEIICLRVVEKDSKLATDSSIGQGKYREEAQKLLDNVIRKNAVEQKAISVVLELAVGRIESVIQRMIQLYEPAALVVGTRGRNLGGMQGLLPGSVSKYCLQHSPVPVIVVRPTSKRTKKKQKRQQELGRSLYGDILEQATQTGRMSLYDKSVFNTDISPQATKQESEAVEKAIGARKGILRNPQHGGFIHTAPDAEADSGQPSFALPIGFLSTESAPRADLALKSPLLQALAEGWDSPGTRGRSPAASAKESARSSAVDTTSVPEGGEENVFGDAHEDSDDESLGAGKIVDHRRPSTRETTPWLNSILRQPERPQSRGRTSRSRSRDRR